MKAKRVAFYCLAGLMVGCVPIVSLNPLFTKGDIVFDEKLLGVWTEEGGDSGTSWEFARFEESAAEGLPKDLQSEFKRVYRLNLADKEHFDGVGARFLSLPAESLRRSTRCYPTRPAGPRWAAPLSSARPPRCQRAFALEGHPSHGREPRAISRRGEPRGSTAPRMAPCCSWVATRRATTRSRPGRGRIAARGRGI